MDHTMGTIIFYAWWNEHKSWGNNLKKLQLVKLEHKAR